MTQVNTPYPSTAYLTGFLRKQGYAVEQADLSLELALRLFSREGLEDIRNELSGQAEVSAFAKFFLEHFDDYARTIEPTLRFLQGKDPTLAHRIAARTLLPQGPRFAILEDQAYPLARAFGELGLQDQAKHIASLYLDDIADLVRAHIDPDFELSRYGEKLAASRLRMDPILERLEREPSLIDRWVDELALQAFERVKPDVFGISVPFPGNVYGAFRMARRFRQWNPGGWTVLGGGYVNTELRSMTDARIHAFFDFITLDDGESPLLNLLKQWSGPVKPQALLRTFSEGEWKTAAGLSDAPFKETATPTYGGLRLDRYFSVLEMLNPMHRFWSDLRWNKLTLAHGCYWKKCNFCDTTLDYIARYESPGAELALARMREVRDETGNSGFHFIDEAAPPALLRSLSEKIVQTGETFTWWGNLRFEKTFTRELALKMADAGCVAVTGGLEVASDRLLAMMNKGVDIEQVARVTHAFSEAGILVHAYLMYGFPTQTVQETVDSLEIVRQLFENGCIQSGFWHRFSATVHSPIGKNPAAFGIEVKRPLEEGAGDDRVFAVNDLPYQDPTGVDHDALGAGLRKALYNFMLGYGLEEDVRAWFDQSMPKTTVPRKRIQIRASKTR